MGFYRKLIFGYDWVRYPFSVTSDVISHLGLVELEQLLEL